MFKRVAKATSKKADVDDHKDMIGDDTPVGIDRLVDESSSSEGEESEGEEDESDDEENDGEGNSDQDDSAEDSEKASKAGFKRKRTEDDGADEEAEEEAAAQVSIDDAIQDPIYVPTEGEKKHGVFASRCIVCEAAVLKTPHLVAAHLEGKAHKRRMERFQRFVQDQLTETQRKAMDARDTVDQMDVWKSEQDEIEKKKLSEAPPSKRALAKKQKAAEFRQKKKEQALKRKAQKAANGDKDVGNEANEKKKEGKTATSPTKAAKVAKTEKKVASKA